MKIINYRLTERIGFNGKLHPVGRSNATGVIQKLRNTWGEVFKDFVSIYDRKLRDKMCQKTRFLVYAIFEWYLG